MISSNDRAFLERLRKEAFGPLLQKMTQGDLDISVYREAMGSLDRWKNEASTPDPDVAYHPEVALRPGLTAAVAVPPVSGPLPVVVITHGNGLAAGSPHLYRRLTKDVAAAGYVAITPDFRLAPEHPFPAAYDDVGFTLRWAHDHAHQWGGDGSRLVLMGDAYGATLGMGVLLGLLDEPDAPRIAAFVGAEGRYDFLPPYMDEVNPWNKVVIGWYLGDGGEALLTDKRVSPLPYIVEGMQLPNILLITGSADRTLSPTLDLARKLQHANIAFQLHVIEGMPHDFMKLPELDGMREGHRLMFDYLAKNV